VFFILLVGRGVLSFGRCEDARAVLWLLGVSVSTEGGSGLEGEG